jgi:hypothetical protein
MRKQITTAAALTCLLASPSFAQTAVGTGIGAAEANSASGAIAVNRGNGNSSSNNALTINNPAETKSTVNSTVSGTTTQNVNTSGTTTSNVNQRVSGSTTSNVNQRQSGDVTNRVVSSGTTTVKTVPSMVAPGLAAAGLETCLGSASGTVSAVGFGIGGGSTYVDEGCQARLDSRTLASYGLKAAAVARLCQRVDIWRSMPDICERYWPRGTPYPYGVAVAVPAVVMSANASANDGGMVRVIDGRDGIEKDCLIYSYSKQKCFSWAGQAPRKQRVASLHAPQRIQVKPKSEPSGPPWKSKSEPAKTEPAKAEPIIP